jgi:hypothetical protein
MRHLFFLIGSQVFAQAGLDFDPPVYTFCIAGINSTGHCAQLCWLKWGGSLLTFSSRLSLNPSPPSLHLPRSWDDCLNSLKLFT